MRIIERDIVGAFIFSSDNKVLLGHNKKGGVYQDQLIVPGGGIETGELKEDALAREVLEETGIDISDAQIVQVNGSSMGESEKILRDSGERVLVKMSFYDFQVTLGHIAADVVLKFEDDYSDARWYESSELTHLPIGPATKLTLEKLKFI
jgi:8-oxo-dGTP pyrophosphatase MutT (NUDIX family)